VSTFIVGGGERVAVDAGVFCCLTEGEKKRGGWGAGTGPVVFRVKCDGDIMRFSLVLLQLNGFSRTFGVRPSGSNSALDQIFHLPSFHRWWTNKKPQTASAPDSSIC
jgi:hypothetical protein